MEIKLGRIPWEKLPQGDWKVRIIVAIGLLGMLLLLLGQCMAAPETTPRQESEYGVMTNEEYTAALEKKLSTLISSIEGVGKAQVMVTLTSSARMVYATEEKTQSDHVQDISGEDRKVQESDNSQISYILVDKGSGQKQPLVTTQLEPEIKGVVVICPGADSKILTSRISDVVTTALGIGANKVCVVKGGT